MCHLSHVTSNAYLWEYGTHEPKTNPAPPPSRGPQSLSWWDLNPGQPKISRTNLDENHVLKSKNHAKNDQEECLIKTQTDGQKIILKQTQTICDCDKNRLSGKDTDCLRRTNIVCDRHIMSLTDNVFSLFFLSFFQVIDRCFNLLI